MIAERWDSKCIDEYVHADQGINFPQMHNCKHMLLIILTQACKGVNWHKWQMLVHLAALIHKNVVSVVNIEYTWTTLKIVSPGIARNHGWVELARWSQQVQATEVWLYFKVLYSERVITQCHCYWW